MCNVQPGHPVLRCISWHGTHLTSSPTTGPNASIAPVTLRAASAGLRSTCLPLHWSLISPRVSLSIGPALTMKFQNPASRVSGRMTYAYMTCAEDMANSRMSPCDQCEPQK